MRPAEASAGRIGFEIPFENQSDIFHMINEGELC